MMLLRCAWRPRLVSVAFCHSMITMVQSRRWCAAATAAAPLPSSSSVTPVTPQLFTLEESVSRVLRQRQPSKSSMVSFVADVDRTLSIERHNAPASNLLAVVLPMLSRARRQHHTHISPALKQALSAWLDARHGELEAKDVAIVFTAMSQLRLACGNDTKAALLKRALTQNALSALKTVPETVDTLVAVADIHGRLRSKRAPDGLATLLARVRSGPRLSALQAVSLLRAVSLMDRRDNTQTVLFFSRVISAEVKTLTKRPLLDCLLVCSLADELDVDFIVETLMATDALMMQFSSGDLAEICDSLLRLGHRKKDTLLRLEAVSTSTRRIMPTVVRAVAAQGAAFIKPEADVILACLAHYNVRHGLLYSTLACVQQR